MSKTYEEYEQELLNKAKEQSDTFATDRKAQADTAAATSNSLYDTALTATEKNYTQSAADAERSYRAVYDANAVNELIARRHAEEAFANTNAARSGLNNTQQTAISLQRSRADADATRQKQAAVDAIMRELDNVRMQYESKKTAASADIYAKADADILDYKKDLDVAARQNATSLYAADKEAQAAQDKLNWEKEQALAEKEYAMYENGYVYDEATGHYSYVGTIEQQKASQNYKNQMMEQGYVYDANMKIYVNLGSEKAARLYYMEKQVEAYRKSDGASGAEEYINQLAERGQIAEDIRLAWIEKYA